MKELKEKYASYNSHGSCKSLSEELSNYYEEDICHILDLTPIRKKRKESLKRLILTSHTSMERTM